MAYSVIVSSKKVDLTDDLTIYGCKAKGLVEIPQLWGLPFFVISHALVDGCKDLEEDQLRGFVDSWSLKILELCKRILPNTSSVILRSSGNLETLEARGQYESSVCRTGEITEALIKLILDLREINKSDEDKISIICQEFREPLKRGHLSNERRCNKDLRDWLCETDLTSSSIGVRKWRNELSIDEIINDNISCRWESKIINELRSVAFWATDCKYRIHFEWVWDGENIWIVQADKEDGNADYGINPEELAVTSVVGESGSMSILEPFSLAKNSVYGKLENCQIYKKLGIQTANLYVLDDISLIESIAIGEFNDELINDLERLCSQPLIIRCDTIEKDKLKRQMLPRTEGVTSVESAKLWLKRQSKEFCANGLGVDSISFLFHNFIPAKSSAFVYAKPSEREVFIESSWGVPESLYYNSHDKYIVDTGAKNFSDLKEDSYGRYSLSSDVRYKSNFMYAHLDGNWKMEKLQPSYEWADSLNYFGERDMAFEIAYTARKICEEVGEPISIMWFVGIPKVIVNCENMPWHHETLDESLFRDEDLGVRKKTTKDSIREVKTLQDVEDLESQLFSEDQKGILLFKPNEELIRDKNAIKKLGTAAIKLKIPIGLEGGVLSHAFYQLRETGAEVEVLSNFSFGSGRREFNKLVRDEIPSNVSKWGESVEVKKVTGESYIQALKNKLVEEAFEVKDTQSKKELMAEIGDVLDVLDALMEQVNIDSAEVDKNRMKKVENSGGFRDGLILTKTTKEQRAESQSDAEELLLIPENSYKTINLDEYTALSEQGDTNSDMRLVGNSKFVLKNVKLPIVFQEENYETRTLATFNGLEEIMGTLKIRRLKSILDISFEVQVYDKENLL